MSDDRAATLEVGTVVKPHGLRGEVIVALVTNRLERLAPGAVLFAAPGGERRRVEVLESRPHQARFLVRFAGVDSIERAEELRGARLFGEPIEDPDAFFVHDLIGRTVRDLEGVERGTVTAVEANPASDLLVVDDRHYVPLRFVVDRPAGGLVVDAPDGLFD